MTVWNIVVPEEYEVRSTGEVKTAYHQVGVAWQLKGGGFSCKLPAGIGLTGHFLLFPRKEKEADGRTYPDEVEPDPVRIA